MDDELSTAREGLVRQIAAHAAGEMAQPEATATAPPARPPDRTEADFAHIGDWGFRRMALQEYQSALGHFRLTGELCIKSKADYAHLYPHDFARHLFEANARAVSDIKAWQREQKRAEEARKTEELQKQRAAELAQRDAEEQARRQEQQAEAEKERELADFRARLLAQKRRLEEEDRGREVGREERNASPAQPAIAAPAIPEGGGLLRGVPFDPHAPGRNARWEPAIPQLELAPVPERLPASDNQTEALLNAIIGECYFYMREVTFPSLCHAGNADDRMGWIGKAVQLAETGATVAKAVARLRHGPGVKETRHTTTIVQNRVDAGPVGGG